MSKIITLVVSPLTDIRTASLGAHILQAVARAEGHLAKVLYANVLLARRLGPERFFAFGPYSKSYAGEALFAPYAYDGFRSAGGDLDENGQHLRFNEEMIGKPLVAALQQELLNRFTSFADGMGADLVESALVVGEWLDEIVALILADKPDAVGCSTMFFDQLAANLAILKRVKALRPEVVTILGGAHCTGVMAAAAFRATSAVDYVFQGEAEVTFVDFLRTWSSGGLPDRGVIAGVPPHSLDEIEIPEFSDYLDQILAPGADGADRWAEMAFAQGVPMETSRGCPWMDSSGCHFCSLNPDLRTRVKSTERVVEEAFRYTRAYAGRRLSFFDLMLSRKQLKELMPAIEKSVPGVAISAEVRPDLSYSDFVLMYDAGLRRVQIGIESLSTDVLRLMNKGVRLRQVLNTMRNCRRVGHDLSYNLIWGFPGETVAAYAELVQLIPKLFHLHPPKNLVHVQFQRHAHYVVSPEQFGLEAVRPCESLSPRVLPEELAADLAFYFCAEYRCETHDDQHLVVELYRLVAEWERLWREPRLDPVTGTSLVHAPQLRVVRSSSGTFRVVDTRTRESWPGSREASPELARAALVETKINDCSPSALREATELGLVALADGWCIPLAIADRDVYDYLPPAAAGGG